MNRDNDNTHESIAESSRRVATMSAEIKAMRVLRWIHEWADGRHAESPTRPEFVKAFEREHGPLPASAERLLRSTAPPVACRRGTGSRQATEVRA